jgi:NAD(P)H-dependent FMN reductase
MADLFLPVLYGSVREPRASFPVAEFVHAELSRRPGVTSRLYDPRELPFGNLVHRVWEMATPDPVATAFVADMTRADGFVIVTPEYNFGIPGALKNLLDHLYQEWNRKPFALVACGGSGGGLRAVDGLRLIVPGLGGVTVPRAVIVHQVQAEFAPDGPKDPEKWRVRLAPLFDDLAWYARALRAARESVGAPSQS